MQGRAGGWDISASTVCCAVFLVCLQRTSLGRLHGALIPVLTPAPLCPARRQQMSASLSSATARKQAEAPVSCITSAPLPAADQRRLPLTSSALAPSLGLLSSAAEESFAAASDVRTKRSALMLHEPCILSSLLQKACSASRPKKPLPCLALHNFALLVALN